MTIPTVDFDAQLHNADWTKQTWDIPAENIEELHEWLAVQGITVAQFKKLPAYTLNVDKLSWLADL